MTNLIKVNIVSAEPYHGALLFRGTSSWMDGPIKEHFPVIQWRSVNLMTGEVVKPGLFRIKELPSEPTPEEAAAVALSYLHATVQEEAINMILETFQHEP